MFLTDSQVRNAKPKSKVYRLKDGQGLFLQVKPNGSKGWRFRYHYAGREKMISFGAYPDFSLADAREKAHEVRKLLGSNTDPSSQRQEQKRLTVFKADNSFEAIAKEWHDLNVSKWKPAVADEIWRRIKNHLLPKLRNRPIMDISSLELLAVVKIVEKEGSTEMSRRIMQYASSIFSYSVVTKRCEVNPALNLKDALKPHKGKHHPTIELSEVPEFLDRLETAPTSRQNKLAIKLLLLTFVRTVELRKSEKSFVHMDKNEWRLPPELTKMKSLHIVPLSRQAKEVLLELEQITGNQKMLFPPQQHQKHLVMSENTVNMVLKRMGYGGRLVGHGFRSLASTSLNEAGHDGDVIERQLDHRERNNVRAAYNHAQYLPQRRELMQTWADMIDAEVLKYRQKKVAVKSMTATFKPLPDPVVNIAFQPANPSAGKGVVSRESAF